MSQSGFTIWKEAASGLYRWLAIYSNKYRDNDHPSEIITEQSQVNFVEMVNKGIVDYPELWLWHVPVAWGKADFVDYIDGFALAAGHVYPGCEPIAESLSKEKNLATSHGMPDDLVLYDPEDKSAIIFHITKEISPLPLHRAANKRTGFVLLKGEEAMPFTDEKRAWLQSAANLPANFVKQLEERIDQAVEEAERSGVQSKELTDALAAVPGTEVAAVEETEAVAVVDTPVVPTAVPAEGIGEMLTTLVKEANFVTRDEVAQAMSEVLKPLMEGQVAMAAQLQSLTKEVSEVRRVETDNQEKLKEVTPNLSLKEMIARNLIGNSSAKVDPNSPLAQDKPKEKEQAAQAGGPTMIPFLNGILTSAANGHQ